MSYQLVCDGCNQPSDLYGDPVILPHGWVQLEIKKNNQEEVVVTEHAHFHSELCMAEFIVKQIQEEKEYKTPEPPFHGQD